MNHWIAERDGRANFHRGRTRKKILLNHKEWRERIKGHGEKNK